MGSGTTAIHSIINNRNFIGSEMSTEYLEIANKRILEVLAKPTLF
jgi:DNA modification methylase